MMFSVQKIENWLAHMPMRARRYTLRALFSTLKIFGRFKVSYVEVMQIAQALRIPIWKAHAIAVEAIFQDILFSLEWAALASRSFDQLSKDAKYVSVEDSSQFEWYSKSKSIILATLHSGCYHIAIAYLVKTYFYDRKIIIIKNFSLTEQELETIEHFKLLGFDISVYTNEVKNEFFDMLRSLRSGAVLFILSDLPKSYGKSSKVEFLDSYAHLSDGVIDLSNICKAPILFFGVKSNASGDVIFSDFSIDISNGIHILDRNVISRRISHFITKEIQKRPHQWQMWSRLDDYYCTEDSVLPCLKDG